VATAVLFVVAAIADAGTALAEARDRAVRAWVETVESSAAALATVVPVSARPAAPTPVASPLPVAPHPRTVVAAHAAADDLDPDERLDLVRARFCPEAARRLCHARQRCGCVYDVPDCEMRLERACTDTLYGAYQTEAEDRELDPGVLARCLDGLADLPTHCVLSAAIVSGCGWPVRDVAERGGTCATAGGPCRGGWCAQDLTCSEPPRVGELAIQGTCPPGLTSINGTCVPVGHLGSACTDYTQCDSGLDDCTEGRCVPRPTIGAHCEDDYGCAPGLRCDDHVCRPAPTWCETDDQCGSEQQCTRPPMACIPCSADIACEGPIRCDDGTYCPEGRQCAEPPTGRCGSTVCRIQSLEGLFDGLR
jgi:hypothetical protein